MILLLIVIYIAFIGLGVPDSLIGSAWTAIYTELNLPVEAVSIITLLIPVQQYSPVCLVQVFLISWEHRK